MKKVELKKVEWDDKLVAKYARHHTAHFDVGVDILTPNEWLKEACSDTVQPHEVDNYKFLCVSNEQENYFYFKCNEGVFIVDYNEAGKTDYESFRQRVAKMTGSENIFVTNDFTEAINFVEKERGQND